MGDAYVYDTAAEWRRAVEQRDRSCQARGQGDLLCGMGLHAHHRLRRSQGGEHTLSNGVLLCGIHHAWVHEHPADAEEMGLLLPSWFVR